MRGSRAVGLVAGFVVALSVVAIAARYEALTITELSVEKIKALHSTLTIESPTITGSTLTGPTLTGAALSVTAQSVVNVTNAQPVTLSAGINVLRGVGGANNATNTITLAAPAGGEIVFVSNAHGATNLVAVAKTGTYKGTAFELPAGESALLVGIPNAGGAGTNLWAGSKQ